MSLGLMLLKKSGKQGTLKFGVTMAAAALGTLILLFVFSITNAINSSIGRSAWSSNIGSSSSRHVNESDIEKPNTVISVVQNNSGLQTFLGKNIHAYSMHFTGGSLPKGSPLDTYPNAGEYYVSPALSTLMGEYPDSVLRNRFTGKQVGLIPSRSLSSPDELAIIQGVDTSRFHDTTSDELMNAVRITDFSVSPYGRQYQQSTQRAITVVMAIGAVGLTVPVMMLITTATALGAREREARYAALRLIGATRRQIRSITLVDSLAASVAGIALGTIAYLLLRPILYNARVSGDRFFHQDILVSPLVFGMIIIAIAGIVWFANKMAMRKVITSPLGVVRKQKLTRSPRIWSMLPLVLSTAGFAYFGSLTKSEADKLFGNSYMYALLGLFALTMLSLLFAGGWLTKQYGRLVGRFSRGASSVLVSRRISHEARQIFRGIGGIVIAFYAGAFFITSFVTISSLSDSSTPGTQKMAPDNSISLSDFEGAKSFGLLQKTIDENGSYQNNPVKIFTLDDKSFISCSDVEHLFRQTCVNGSGYITFPQDSDKTKLDMTKTVRDKPTPTTPDNLTYVSSIYIPRSSSPSQVSAERVVTANVQNGNTGTVFVINRATRQASIDGMVKSFKDLLYAGIILTIIVASLNLVVATVTGVFERKGSFLTLRLGGAEMPFLRQTVIRESMFPLVFISLISIVLGLYSAYVFLKLASNTLGRAFVLPELPFWVCVIAVFVLSYVGILLILPMLNRLTDTESNPTE